MTNLTLIAYIMIAQSVSSATGACAHRGDMKNAPENTVPAFECAVKLGAHQIEFDVQLSKDGELVIMHDATVDRTTDGTGAVSDLTFAELRRLDAGRWFSAEFAATQIPTLRETLEAIPEKVLCNVHLKNSPGVAAATAKAIAEMDRLGQCFLACTTEQADEAKTVVPDIKICNMSRQGGDRTAYVDLTLERTCEFIQLHQNNGTNGLQEAVNRLHAGGVTVNFYGARDEPTIRALAEGGVDYILTDDLPLCLAILNEYAKTG